MEDIRLGSTYKAIRSSMLMLSPVMALTALNPLALLLTGMTYLSLIVWSDGKESSSFL